MSNSATTVQEILDKVTALLEREVPQRNVEGRSQYPAHVWGGHLRDEVYALRNELAEIKGMCIGRLFLENELNKPEPRCSHDMPVDLCDLPHDDEPPLPSDEEIEYRMSMHNGTHTTTCSCDMCSL